MTSAPAGGWTGSEAEYAASYRSMLRLAYVLTGDGPTAEDVVHDVFVAAGPRLSQLDNPAAYLHRAVTNRCRSVHRRAEVRRRIPLPVPGIAQLDPGLTELRDALAGLSERQRAALVLRFLCDLPDEQIADILDCRQATVRSLVQRGLAELREVLEK